MRILSSEYLSKHPYFTARKDAYQLETGKEVDPYFVVEMPPSACAVALTEENKIILIRQYRYPVNEILYELPGGFIEKEEDPAKAIARELEEETGYSFKEIISLGTTFANPGVLNNTTYFFLAKGGKKTGEQQLDPNEEIEILFKTIEEVKQLLYSGEIKQSMHALCLYRAIESKNI